MFLSIIIPVYNTAPFLPECLNSLINQDIQKDDYEIICVNDGSTDDSDQIIQSYCFANTNIRHINKQNAGVSSARNLGIKAALGEWLWFVDSDDFVQENVLSELKDLSTAEVDRISFPRYCFKNKLSASEFREKENGQIASNNPGRGIWCSLYRRKIISEHDILFNIDIDYGEDIVWLCQFREYMRSEIRSERVCYFYRIHSNSAMHQTSTQASHKKIKSYVKAGLILYDKYQSQLEKRSDTADDVMFFLRLTMLEIAKIPTRKDRKQYIDEVRSNGLFPFTTLKESTLKKAFVTRRSDIWGRVYNSLVLNSTNLSGFILLTLWYRFYYIYKSTKNLIPIETIE